MLRKSCSSFEQNLFEILINDFFLPITNNFKLANRFGSSSVRVIICNADNIISRVNERELIVSDVASRRPSILQMCNFSTASGIKRL